MVFQQSIGSHFAAHSRWFKGTRCQIANIRKESPMDDRQVPPAYNEVGQHGVFPQAIHDERARFNFLANLNG